MEKHRNIKILVLQNSLEIWNYQTIFSKRKFAVERMKFFQKMKSQLLSVILNIILISGIWDCYYSFKLECA